jgi:5-methylcytosine-specific restriction endonuclease McrA
MRNKINNQSTWAEVIVKYLGGNCGYCGSKKNIHIHHSIPQSRGGPNEMSNLELLCRDCHHKIHVQIHKLIPNKTPKNVKGMKKHDCGTYASEFTKGTYFCESCNSIFYD